MSVSIGNTSTGNSTQITGPGSPNQIGTPITLPTPGTVHSITMRVHGGPDFCRARGVMWSSSGSVLSYTDALIVNPGSQGFQWYTWTFSNPSNFHLSQTGTYYIGFVRHYEAQLHFRHTSGQSDWFNDEKVDPGNAFITPSNLNLNTSQSTGRPSFYITYTPDENVGTVKIWTGTQWKDCPVKVWDGQSWVTKPVKIWTGSEWKIVG